MKNNNTPLTFGKVLVQNSEAMTRYLELPQYIQEKIRYASEKITTEEEMKTLVNSINDL